MPHDAPIPYTPPVNMEDEPLHTSKEEISTRYALALVTETFDKYETYRSNNCDTRWSTHDELYFGVTQAKYWEGTTVPRANLANQIIFDQVEMMVAALYQNIFNIGPEWFQVAAEKGVDPTEAAQIHDVLSYYLEHPGDEGSASAKAEITFALKDLALHGNGGVMIEWDVVNQRPRVQYIDLRDVYVDPTCKTPSVDSARSVIIRKVVTVDDLIALRSDPRMTIPADDVLSTMSRQLPVVRGDRTKQNQEAMRGVNFNPTAEGYSPLPSDRYVEVLIYYSRSRIIWILNRERVAFNSPNPYQFIPLCFAPCYTVVGRFYAQSIADVQEGNQRYITALLNARLDELSLQLIPPRAVPRGSNLTPNQLKWRPGAVYQFDQPKDVQVMFPPGSTANVFNEISYLELSSEKRTGLSGLTGGIPRPSNANRTLGGMQMQLQGSGNRLSDIVSNIENFLLVPLLYKLYKMIRFHTDSGEMLSAYDSNQNLYQVPATIAQKKCRFRMSAASRMVTRDKLLQTFPFLAQFILQGPIVDQLQRAGKTVNFEELFRMLQDATNVGQLYQLIRPLSPQEQQALQQPDPKTAAEMQKAQMEAQTKLQVAQIQKMPSPGEMEMQKLAAQIDMQKAQQEMQIEREKAQMDMFVKMMLGKIKVQGIKDEMQMKMADRQAQMQFDSMERQQNMQSSAIEHQMNIQQQVEKARVDNAIVESKPEGPTRSSQSKRNPRLTSRTASKPVKRKTKDIKE